MGIWFQLILFKVYKLFNCINYNIRTLTQKSVHFAKYYVYFVCMFLIICSNSFKNIWISDGSYNEQTFFYFWKCIFKYVSKLLPESDKKKFFFHTRHTWNSDFFFSGETCKQNNGHQIFKCSICWNMVAKMYWI
jgi:hypothetical protein